MTDEELIQRIRNGETHLFTQIVERYKNLVYMIIQPFCRDTAECEDVFQDVFMRVFEKLPQFQFRSSLGTWIGRIAFHHAVNIKKKRNKEDFLFELENWENEKHLHFQRVDGPDQQFVHRELQEMVQQAVNRLPYLYRTIVWLYHRENFSYQKIAEILDMPLGTVKNYLFRARKLLKQQLAPIILEEVK